MQDVAIFSGQNLLSDLEAGTPDGESSEVTTAAQDCWICVDTSVRIAIDEEYPPSDSLWYVLEPMMQDTSNRIFGVTDVGSDKEEELASAILADARMNAAVASCREAIRVLSATEKPTSEITDHIVKLLKAVAP